MTILYDYFCIFDTELKSCMEVKYTPLGGKKKKELKYN